MIPKGVFTQTLLIIISVGIVITYVKPEFSNINETQGKIATYKEERDMVISVNSQLSDLVANLENNVTNDDQRRLFTYLPNDVDEISIARDVYIMVQESGLLYNDVSYLDSKDSRSLRKSVEVDNAPTPYSFELSVEGSYSQIKHFFGLLSQNNYLLEIQDLTIEKIEGGFLKVNMNFNAYSYNNSAVSD